MSWLLLLPAWIKVAIGSLAVIGVLQVRHWMEVRSLKGQITELTQGLDREKAVTVELRVAVSEVQRNRDQLTAEIRRQNDAITRLTLTATAAESKAALAAARALESGRKLSEALRAPTSTVPPGHDAMNTYLRERFQ